MPISFLIPIAMGAIGAITGWVTNKILKGPVDNVLKGADNNGNPQATDVANVAAASAGEHEITDEIQHTGTHEQLPWVTTNNEAINRTTLENPNPQLNPSVTLENMSPATAANPNFLLQILSLLVGANQGPSGGLPL